MRIIVLVKEVPDTYGDRRLDLTTGLTERAGSEAILDEISERALEVALTYADANKETEVIVLTMAPASAQASLRKALAMGASSAVQVVDAELVGADLSLTAEVLAAALTRVGFDLVLAGNESTDGSGGVLPAMLAELLNVPAALNVSAVEITADGISAVRVTDEGTARVSTAVPAVVSITEALPDARFPNFRGILAAKKKPFETVSLADLGVVLSPEMARSVVVGLSERPPRAAGLKIVDEGDAGERLAEFLVSYRLVEG